MGRGARRYDPAMGARGFPLRSKLALMFVSVALITFGAGGYLVSDSARRAIAHEVTGRLEFQSRAYRTALDAYLGMLMRRCEDFASDGLIRGHAEILCEGADEVVTDELKTHLLQNKLPLVEAFCDLTLIAPDGKILVAAHSSPDPELASKAASQRSTWCSGLLEVAEPEGALRFVIATPLFRVDRSEQVGVLVAWVHLPIWIDDALSLGGVGEGTDVGDVALHIIDSDGTELKVPTQLTHPSRPSVDSDLVKDGFGLELVEGAVPAGGPGVHSFPIAANGWHVRVEMLGDEIYRAAADLQSRIVGLGVILSVAACVLFLLPMNFLTRPLLRLAAATRRIAGGDVSARVPVDSDDEIGELAGAFNSMAEAVEERTQRLEQTAQHLRERQGELGHERDRLRAVISSMRDGLVVLDSDGELVLHNRASGPLLKQLRSERSAITAHHVCDGAKNLQTECRSCLFSPEVGPRSCVVEIEGGVFEIQAARLAPDAGGRSGRVLVSRDVSDRIAEDERQIHQGRLAVLGEVAAVMAHELNNPLAAISMYNQMLASELSEDARLSENVDVIQRNVESCTRTIRDLLDYATDATPEVGGGVDVNATLEDVSAFLRPIRERSDVELRMTLHAEPLDVTGDELQIRQVFVNLFVNAIQAVGSGGHVSVRSTAVDGFAVIHVADDGCGIPREVRERIFRPFFTTKERGEGTGLGLPTARRIAEMHGGGLDLVHSDETGTEFRVRLRLQLDEAP